MLFMLLVVSCLGNEATGQLTYNDHLAAGEEVSLALPGGVIIPAVLKKIEGHELTLTHVGGEFTICMAVK